MRIGQEIGQGVRGEDRVMIVEVGEMDVVGKGGGKKRSGNFEWMTKRLFIFNFIKTDIFPT